MIEIIPAAKLKLESATGSDNNQLLVCVHDAKGRLLFITELTKYFEELREQEEKGE